MTHSTPVSFLGSEFDDFLFAPIGEDRNGMPISVLSALARHDVDMKQSAAEAKAALGIKRINVPLPSRFNAVILGLVPG